MKTGIYKIECLVSKKVYIGQSKDIHKRWSVHRANLSGGNHCNQHLQSAWRFYGRESFSFSILEECGRDDLIEREQYWISHYQSLSPEFGYNIIGECGYDKNKKKKVVEPKPRKTKPVIVLSTLGTRLSVENSAKEASKKYNANLKRVQECLSTWSSTNPKTKKYEVNGHVFVYEEDYSRDKSYIPQENYKKRRVGVKRPKKPKGEYIRVRVPVTLVHESGAALEFRSISEAISSLKLVPTKVYKCLKDQKYKHRGYTFKINLEG